MRVQEPKPRRPRSPVLPDDQRWREEAFIAGDKARREGLKRTKNPHRVAKKRRTAKTDEQKWCWDLGWCTRDRAMTEEQ